MFLELNEVLVILAQVFLLHFLFPQKHQKATIEVRRRKGEEGGGGGGGGGSEHR